MDKKENRLIQRKWNGHFFSLVFRCHQSRSRRRPTSWEDARARTSSLFFILLQKVLNETPLYNWLRAKCADDDKKFVSRSRESMCAARNESIIGTWRIILSFSLSMLRLKRKYQKNGFFFCSFSTTNFVSISIALQCRAPAIVWRPTFSGFFSSQSVIFKKFYTSFCFRLIFQNWRSSQRQHHDDRWWPSKSSLFFLEFDRPKHTLKSFLFAFQQLFHIDFGHFLG